MRLTHLSAVPMAQHNYQRSCPTYKGACQASTSTVNTGLLGQYNTNTTSTYVNPRWGAQVLGSDRQALRGLQPLLPPPAL